MSKAKPAPTVPPAPPDAFSRARPMPLYEQIAEHISSLIGTGMLPNGCRLPSEGELAERLGVARGTVRRAVEELISRGLIKRAHGVGTFVSISDRQLPGDSGLGPLRSTGERLQDAGISFDNVLLERKVVGQSPAIGPFQASRALYIRRLRVLFDGPASVTETLLSLDLLPGLDQVSDEEFAVGSLHALLKTRFGVEFSRTERFFSAEIASADVAGLLDVPEGAAVLGHEDFNFTSPRDCIEYSQSRVRTDRHKYAVVMHDDGSR